MRVFVKRFVKNLPRRPAFRGSDARACQVRRPTTNQCRQPREAQPAFLIFLTSRLLPSGPLLARGSDSIQGVAEKPWPHPVMVRDISRLFV